MRDVSRRDFEMSLSDGSVRRVRREVSLVMGDVWGMPMLLMTIGRMSTLVPGQKWRMVLVRGIYLS
jgi:hypothetical protein